MKKFLLGTSALAAASLAAGSVQAAEPIKLMISGYYSAGVSVTDEDFDAEGAAVFPFGDLQHVHVRQDGEIHFSGETTLDNGLSVGVQVELEAFTTDDQIDEHYVWFEGTFGQLRIGADDHVAEQMHSFVPTATPGGSDTPTYFLFNTAFLVTPNTAGTGSTSDENKIIYFTPRFNGFQLGASYAPNGTDSASGGEGGQYGTKLDTPFSYEESFSVAVNFVQQFNSVGIDIGASYQLETINDIEDDDVIGGHAYLTFGGLTIGASGKYSDSGTIGGMLPAIFNDGEFYSFGGGLLYQSGLWTFSLGATRTKADSEFFFADFEYESTLVDAGVSYTLGPGVYLWAFAQYFEEELDLDAGPQLSGSIEHDGVAGMVGSTLSF